VGVRTSRGGVQQSRDAHYDKEGLSCLDGASQSSSVAQATQAPNKGRTREAESSLGVAPCEIPGSVIACRAHEVLLSVAKTLHEGSEDGQPSVAAPSCKMPT